MALLPVYVRPLSCCDARGGFLVFGGRQAQPLSWGRRGEPGELQLRLPCPLHPSIPSSALPHLFLSREQGAPIWRAPWAAFAEGLGQALGRWSRREGGQEAGALLHISPSPAQKAGGAEAGQAPSLNWHEGCLAHQKVSSTCHRQRGSQRGRSAVLRVTNTCVSVCMCRCCCCKDTGAELVKPKKNWQLACVFV